MALRGHMPLQSDGRPIQPPGSMRDGLFPALGPASSHHPLDLHSSSDILERKQAMQGAEMEQLAIENQRLASSHVFLRRELAVTQLDMDKVGARMRNIQAEGEFESVGLTERIANMEADLQAGESLHKDLQEACLEAKRLVASRQELNAEIQKLNNELQSADTDLKFLPEMRAELDSLRQEHQKLRDTFEYEKGFNIELVERMHEMERNLVLATREVEMLQAEVLNVERRAHGNAVNPYGDAYGSANYMYSYHGQYGVPGAFPDGYGMRQVQPSGGVLTEGMSPYGGNGGAAASGGGGASNKAVAGAAPPY